MNKISQPLANITNKENIEYPTFKTVQSKSAIYESARSEEIQYRAPQSTYIRRPVSELVDRPSSVGYIPQKTPTLFWIVSIILVIFLIGALMMKVRAPIEETQLQNKILAEIISDSLQQLVKISGKVPIQKQFEELRSFYGDAFDPSLWVQVFIQYIQIQICLQEKFQIKDDGQGFWYY